MFTFKLRWNNNDTPLQHKKGYFSSANTYTEVFDDERFYHCGEKGYCVNGIGKKSFIDEDAGNYFEGFNSEEKKQYAFIPTRIIVLQASK